MSAATRDLVADRLAGGASVRDLGSHRLKDLGAVERVWQLCHPDLADDFGPLRTLDAVANNLPAQLTSFVGREDELARLGATLEASRLVTLTGAGGCGKSRLALHAAAQAAEHHPGGVWWVELGPVSDPEVVPSVVARAFGLREEERPLIATICERLAGLDAVLALDNCEHLIGACTDLVERVLAAAPGVRVVATSREPLGIAGEVTWRVPSLADTDAARLFVDRAAQVRPRFAPDAGELEVIAEICRRLDGIPLAIELAAARTRMMSPGRIAAALDDRFRLLTGGGRTAMPRQQTLELSVGWSHDLLEAEERALLRRLSVFTGGFTLEAAEDVCAWEPLDRYVVLDLLSRLVDKSLVLVEHGDEDRYRLLETIRLYAGQRLADAGEAPAARDRHLGCLLDLAEGSEPAIAFAESGAVLARLAREHDNFRAAMDWADASGAHESFLRLATALTLFWELHGHMQGAGRWFARALARDDGPSAVRARALWGAAHTAIYSGDAATLTACAPAALQMAEEVGDEIGLARALNVVGLSQAWILPEPVQARATLARSIELADKNGDLWGVGDGWKMLTTAWLQQEDHAGLERPNLELLRLGQRLRNPFFLGWHHLCVGWAAMRRGELDVARDALQTAIDLDVEVGGGCTAGLAPSCMAEVEYLRGDYDAASARLYAFLARDVVPGAYDRGLYPDSIGVVFALPLLGRIGVAAGSPGEVIDTLAPFVTEVRPIGMPLSLGSALNTLGLAYLTIGQTEAAAVAFTEAHDLGSLIQNPWLAGYADHGLGEVARARGELTRAGDLHHRALAGRAGRGLLPGVIESLEALARLTADCESHAEAARLLAAADALRTRLGIVRCPGEQTVHEGEVDRLSVGLGEPAYQAAWAEGAALPVAAAVAYASRARGERKRPSSGWAGLTPTEIEVVRLVAQGLTNPEVAERLFIGRGTVKSHLGRVFTKLDVSTRAELAALATRRGI